MGRSDLLTARFGVRIPAPEPKPNSKLTPICWLGLVCSSRVVVSQRHRIRGMANLPPARVVPSVGCPPNRVSSTSGRVTSFSNPRRHAWLVMWPDLGYPPVWCCACSSCCMSGGGLAAPVLVVDLDHLFAGRLIAALRLRRRLRSRTLAFAAGHSQTVHEPAASTRKGTHPNCRRQAIAI